MTKNEAEIAEVLRQIGEGRSHLENQAARITRLEDVGEDTSDAKAVLSRLNEAQQIYIDQLGRLEEQSRSAVLLL